MLISCQCSNFVATSPQLQRSSSVGSSGDGCVNGNALATGIEGPAGESTVAAMLSQAFMQKCPRSFLFYMQCMDFFKHAYGPIPELSINAIGQHDLIYGLTLDAAGQSWQLSICIYCRSVLCAKRLTTVASGAATASPSTTQYLINCALLTSNSELAQRRASKSYSETFELLIMNYAQLHSAGDIQHNGNFNQTVGSLSSAAQLAPMDGKMLRLRKLQSHQQSRVKLEIAETNERIERFTEQQFALLKSFREKCDQEYAQLSRVIMQMPEQTSELLDQARPVALEVTGSAINYAVGGPVGSTRRRNTISSRRELNCGIATVPSTPTTPLNQTPSFLPLPQASQQQQLPSATFVTARKMSSFDTPPATPEATPMSVGNSPTFRQQAAGPAISSLLLSSTATAAVHATDDNDDCQFDLEDVDTPTPLPALNHARAHTYQQQQQQQQRLQQQQQKIHANMNDDVDDGVPADEAEDALDLESSMPIAMHKRGARATPAQMNFAKSLPIVIANSPLMERANNNNNNFVVENDDVLDNAVDIAASIKALAKSVHGEAVFGDLPRPRLRSQI